MAKAITFLLFSILNLYLPDLLLAQQDSIQERIRFKRGFCEDVGFVKGDFFPLNGILKENGFPALEDTYFWCCIWDFSETIRQGFI